MVLSLWTVLGVDMVVVGCVFFLGVVFAGVCCVVRSVAEGAGAGVVGEVAATAVAVVCVCVRDLVLMWLCVCMCVCWCWCCCW